MSWSGSTRKARLPANWQTLRKHVLERDQHRCQHPGCHAKATDVDHKKPGDDHTLGNLEALCGPHHRAKSAHEGAQARWQERSQRPPETHPGLAQPS